jgi:hypothetical protein
MSIKLRVFELKNDLERQLGRPISNREISRATEVPPHTIGYMMRNEVVRVSLPNLTALLAYFREQGLDIGPGDLLGED